MPLYVFLRTGVSLIGKVTVTTQDEDKSGKAAVHNQKSFSCSLTDSH